MSTLATITANSLGKVRRAKMHGRDYIVAPVSMLVPGVLNGSQGPLLYGLEDIQKSVDDWNYVPITLDHPREGSRFISARSPGIINRQGLGFVFNATTAKSKLDAEAWFDAEVTQAMAPMIFNNLNKGRPIELSTGLVVDSIQEQGVYRGRSYVGRAINHKPDHLAILLNYAGACSLRDGCGVLVNYSPKSRLKQWLVSNAAKPPKKPAGAKGQGGRWVTTKEGRKLFIDGAGNARAGGPKGKIIGEAKGKSKGPKRTEKIIGGVKVSSDESDGANLKLEATKDYDNSPLGLYGTDRELASKGKKADTFEEVSRRQDEIEKQGFSDAAEKRAFEKTSKRQDAVEAKGFSDAAEMRNWESEQMKRAMDPTNKSNHKPIDFGSTKRERAAVAAEGLELDTGEHIFGKSGQSKRTAYDDPNDDDRKADDKALNRDVRKASKEVKDIKKKLAKLEAQGPVRSKSESDARVAAAQARVDAATKKVESLKSGSQSSAPKKSGMSRANAEKQAFARTRQAAKDNPDMSAADMVKLFQQQMKQLTGNQKGESMSLKQWLVVNHPDPKTRLRTWLAANYNAAQPRGPDGKWSAGGGGVSVKGGAVHGIKGFKTISMPSFGRNGGFGEVRDERNNPVVRTGHGLTPEQIESELNTKFKNHVELMKDAESGVTIAQTKGIREAIKGMEGEDRENVEYVAKALEKGDFQGARSFIESDNYTAEAVMPHINPKHYAALGINAIDPAKSAASYEKRYGTGGGNSGAAPSPAAKAGAYTKPKYVMSDDLTLEQAKEQAKKMGLGKDIVRIEPGVKPPLYVESGRGGGGPYVLPDSGKVTKEKAKEWRKEAVRRSKERKVMTTGKRQSN